MTEKFLQSYVYTEFGDFFVSTCFRESIIAIGYYETFAWKMENGKRVKWVADNSGALVVEKAYQQHLEVIRQLQATGKFQERE